MILEYTQILYTAFYLSSSTEQLSDAPLNESTGRRGYMSVRNKKHPSVLWCAMSLAHYMWLISLALNLVTEYNFRYQPSQPHKCLEHLQWLSKNPPKGLFHQVKWLCGPTPAMPDEYKVTGDSIQSYRNYYRGSKKDRGLLVYTRRHIPHWI